MIDIHPPVHKVTIGLLRSIVLFDKDRSIEMTSYYTHLGETKRVKQVFGQHPFMIIAEIDTASPVLVDPENKVSGVYVDSTYEDDKLTRIADSLENFYQNALLVQKAWEGKEAEFGLEKTPENLALRDEIMDEIKSNNPASDEGFWNFLAFREFEIRLRE
jgi:hypothetical protein